MTPEEAYTGIRLNLVHLRIIGSLAYCHIPDSKRNKFEPKAVATILLGYDELSKAYRCYNPTTHRILVSCDVRFDEQLQQLSTAETTEPLEIPFFLSNTL